MRIYLAARFGRHSEMQGYAQELELLGYTVVSRWHTELELHQNAAFDEEPTDEQRASWASDDVADVSAADMVVSFTETPRSETSGRGGRHVEFGMGLALSKILIIIGPKEHVFHGLPQVVQFETWETFVHAISAD